MTRGAPARQGPGWATAAAAAVGLLLVAQLAWRDPYGTTAVPGAEPGTIIVAIAPETESTLAASTAVDAQGASAANAGRDDQVVGLPNLLRFGSNRLLYLFDIVLVPRHAHVVVSSLMPEGVTLKRREVFVNWTIPDANYTLLAHPCTVLPTLDLGLEDGEPPARTATCEKLDAVDGNLRGKRTGFALYRLGSDALDRLVRFAHIVGPEASVRIPLVGNLSALVRLRSRSAGLMRNTTRRAADLSDPRQFNDPFGRSRSRASASLSVCIKHLESRTTYIHELVTYYRRIGASHVYIGILGEEVAQYVEHHARWFLATGFLSLVSMHDTPGVSIGLAKSVFLYSCLHHAKQEDTFVAVVDVDEVPVVMDRRFRGRDRLSLARYLYDEISRGNITAGPLKSRGVWNAPEHNNSHPVAYFCEISLLGSIAMHPNPSGKYKGPRTSNVGKDFPLQSEEASYFRTPWYMKSIAVAATTNMLEIHQHSNCKTADASGLRFEKGEKIREKVPYERRLYPSQHQVIVLHFPNMHVSRYATSTARHKFLPSEFSRFMADYIF